MNFQDYFVNLILSGVMIIGAYQFYFYTQRYPLRKEIVWNSPIDEKSLSARVGRGYTAFFTTPPSSTSTSTSSPPTTAIST